MEASPQKRIVLHISIKPRKDDGSKALNPLCDESPIEDPIVFGTRPRKDGGLDSRFIPCGGCGNQALRIGINHLTHVRVNIHKKAKPKGA